VLLAVFPAGSDWANNAVRKPATIAAGPIRHNRRILPSLETLLAAIGYPIIRPDSRAAFTLAGVNGTGRIRAPLASEIAVASAPRTGGSDASPAPISGWSGRSISDTSICGTSVNRITG